MTPFKGAFFLHAAVLFCARAAVSEQAALIAISMCSGFVRIDPVSMLRAE